MTSQSFLSYERRSFQVASTRVATHPGGFFVLYQFCRVAITRSPTSSRFRRQSIGLPLRAQGCGLLSVFRIDLEEVVEDDHEHGGAAEEDGEGVERCVGDHLDGSCGGLEGDLKDAVLFFMC